MSQGDLRLLVGLGNPGSKYRNTRHNIGFMALEKLAAKHETAFKKQRNIFGQIAEVGVTQNRTRLLLPDTYMNESGKSIRACLDWFDIEISQILVLVDDMDLPLGKLRLRAGGGSGGHNGLRSSIQHLKTENFSRLRIGIGSPPGSPELRKLKTVSHVLGGFTPEEKPVVTDVINEVIAGINLIQKTGIDKAANHLNSFLSQKINV